MSQTAPPRPTSTAPPPAPPQATYTTAPPAPMYCYRHPDRETLIRCSRCNRPICLKCQVRHPVGIRCRECAQIRKDPLSSLTPVQYVLAFATALGGGVIGGFIAPFLGILFGIFIGPLIGGAIAEFVGRVIGYKRGLPLQIIVAVCIVAGVVIAQGLLLFVRIGPALVQSAPGTLIGLAINALIGSIVYIIFAIGGAVARLR